MMHTIAKKEIPSRRRFLGTSLATCTACLLGEARGLGAPAAESRFQYCAFTKFLQSLSFDELADTIAELGFHGIEAAIRPGGHVEPERVEEDLPRMHEALQKRGLEVAIMASDINRLDQPHTKRVLQTAANLGISMYRMAYFRYDMTRPVVKQLDDIRRGLDVLIEYGAKLGITAVYQNHSGTALLGAPIWDLYELVKNHSPDHFGVALDIGHTTVEGGICWPIHVNLMEPYLRAIYVKDFQWNDRHVEWIPLGEGRIDPEFFAWLQKSDFSGPVSVHVEYLDRTGAAEHVKALRRDIATLKNWLDR